MGARQTRYNGTITQAQRRAHAQPRPLLLTRRPAAHALPAPRPPWRQPRRPAGAGRQWPARRSLQRARRAPTGLGAMRSQAGLHPAPRHPSRARRPARPRTCWPRSRPRRTCSGRRGCPRGVRGSPGAGRGHARRPTAGPAGMRARAAAAARAAAVGSRTCHGPQRPQQLRLGEPPARGAARARRRALQALRVARRATGGHVCVTPAAPRARPPQGRAQNRAPRRSGGRRRRAARQARGAARARARNAARAPPGAPNVGFARSEGMPSCAGSE